MDELKLLAELIKTQGLAGVLAAILVWDKLIYPQWKKRNGSFVSYKEIDDKLLNHGMRLIGMENKLGYHLERMAKDDIKMAKIETEHDHFKESMQDFKENQKAIFKMISEIKNMMIEDRK